MSRSSGAGLLATCGEPNASMTAQSHAFRVLFGMVPVEMVEEVCGRQRIWHLTLVSPLSDFRQPNYFQISKVV